MVSRCYDILSTLGAGFGYGAVLSFPTGPRLDGESLCLGTVMFVLHLNSRDGAFTISEIIAWMLW